MELKNYQLQVLNDLDNYINKLLINRTPSKAYDAHWNSKGVRVGFDGMATYKDIIPGVPSVCLKVPTGGGKTLLGCASLKRIFDKMSIDKKKAVVWLVPWDTILTQTYNNLSNPEHFYHQQLARDFSNRVEVYNKKQAINAQNLNVSNVSEQLSIFVMSFDTFRSKTKENRKIYEANPNLAQMTAIYETKDTLVENVDETALINVLNQLNPVVIIDESHNAKSNLSIEMIKNLNPSFVVELTATPKENSNIISIVSAESLKDEHMVKLPVIAYNRPSIERVIIEAIDLQNVLENHAKALYEKEIENNKTYIRPIVLFQAQPKNDDDNITFDKIKQQLVNSGIKPEYIAIKTANINEIANIDLMSPKCQIRYIITVNALKEGWDCPFAYILASLANKTSKVDVEQILGRILRQPYQMEFVDKILNMSYVLSCSNDFNETLKSIVAGLNASGFTKNDCRVIDKKEPIIPQPLSTPISLFDNQQSLSRDSGNEIDATTFNLTQLQQELKNTVNNQKSTEDDSALTDTPSEVILAVNIEDTNTNISTMLEDAKQQNDSYQQKIDASKKEGLSGIAPEIRDNMNNYKMNPKYKDEFKSIKLPQFYHKCEANLFGEDDILVTKEDLSDGFKLSEIPTPTGLTNSIDNVFKVDIESTDEGSYVKQVAMGKNDSDAFKKILSMFPDTARLNVCKRKLVDDLNNKLNTISFAELTKYIDRIVDDLKEDELIDLQNNIMSVELKIKDFINAKLDEYRYNHFKELLEMEKIFTKDTYEFPEYIHPTIGVSLYPSSLYAEEDGNLTDVETEFVTKVSSLENVKCWHRIIEKKGYCINGYLNHYPDFVVFTKKGKIIFVETKGEHLSNDDSSKKLELGQILANKADNNKYRYYMAFMKNPMNENGSNRVDKIIEIISNL